MATFYATDGDIIKSQRQFAIYDRLNGWSGTLNYLETNKGYMLKSSKNQSFRYPRIVWDFANGSVTAQEIMENQQELLPEFEKYSDNMNAVVFLPNGYNELFAYDDEGTLKGKAVNQNVGLRELSFITVYGDKDMELPFNVGDGENIRPTQKTFNFSANNLLGTVANPIVLRTEIFEKILLYLNPFKNELNLRLSSNEVDFVNVDCTMCLVS